jgi:hypothetical protein
VSDKRAEETMVALQVLFIILAVAAMVLFVIGWLI